MERTSYVLCLPTDALVVGFVGWGWLPTAASSDLTGVAIVAVVAIVVVVVVHRCGHSSVGKTGARRSGNPLAQPAGTRSSATFAGTLS
jgi:hypothetical protein